MILLDTDHLSILQDGKGDRFLRLNERLRTVSDAEPVATSVVTFEEQMRGWLAAIAKERLSQRQVGPYRRLSSLAEFFADFEIVDFDEAAADQFDELRRTLRRIGTMDLKIAAVAMVNDALLLTANRRDFIQVPGLRMDNWLAP